MRAQRHDARERVPAARDRDYLLKMRQRGEHLANTQIDKK